MFVEVLTFQWTTVELISFYHLDIYFQSTEDLEAIIYLEVSYAI